MQRARQRVADLGRTDPETCLFPCRRAVGYLALGVFLGVSKVACVAGSIGAGLLGRRDLAFTLFAIGAVLWLLDALVDLALRRHARRHNAGARVALVSFVQANGDLYESDNTDMRWGFVLLDRSRAWEADPTGLRRASWMLFRAKMREIQLPPPLTALVERIRSEEVEWVKRQQPGGADLPDTEDVAPELVGDRRTSALDILVHPKELPQGHLDRNLWPALVNATDRGAPVTLLPKKYWWTPEVDTALGELWWPADEPAGD